jgi:hypothetical protein
VGTKLRNRLAPLAPYEAPGTSAVTVTSGTADYGAWVELTAATSDDWDGFVVYNPSSTSSLFAAGNNHPCLLDIGIGASTAETVLIGGVDISNKDNGQFRPLVLDVPWLRVAAGSRISARISSATSARTIGLAVAGYRSTTLPSPITKATAFVTPASQRGVSITPGTAWTEVVAATPVAVDALIVGLGSNDNGTAASAQTFELAVGASGVESVVHATHYWFTTSEQFINNFSGAIPLRLPAGARIVARCTTETMSVTVHGLS